MIPKKHKEVLQKVISKNGLDDTFTQDAVSFYWSEVRKHLSELTYPAITIRRLGIFVVKPWKINEYAESYKKHLDDLDSSTFEKFRYKRKIETQYEKLCRIKAQLEQEDLRRIEAKERKKEYESIKTMGEQIQDNGGSPEQCDQEG